MKNMPNYAKNYFGKIGHKIFCQRHQNFARFSKSGKNYAKLATLYCTTYVIVGFIAKVDCDVMNEP